VRIVVSLVMTLLAATAAAADAPTIEGAWVRATPPNAPTGAAYLTIRGGDREDRLTGAHTAVAQTVEIHTTVRRDGMMHMQPVPELVIAPHGRVELAPGAEHLMLIGLARALAAGDQVSITLVFEHAGSIDVVFPVIDARTQQPARAP
jgi:copper(I)-binding protein